MKITNYLLGAVLTAFLAAGAIASSIQSSAAAGAPVPAATPTPTPATPPAGRIPAEFINCNRFGVPFGKVKEKKAVKARRAVRRRHNHK